MSVLVADCFIVERYAQQLQSQGGKLYLTGVHPHVLKQLELTETTETITPESIYLAEDTLGTSTLEAYQAGRDWLNAAKEE
jgi:hypothetical protein